MARLQPELPCRAPRRRLRPLFQGRPAGNHHRRGNSAPPAPHHRLRRRHGPDRFDVELIEHLSIARPAWSIVLVGPPRADMDLSRIQKLPNVYLTGNKAIADLPNYLKGMDVTLVPYKLNDVTRNIYPLKLQEYRPTGKPVVSSAMPLHCSVRRSRAHRPLPPGVCHAHRGRPRGRLAEARATRQAIARENSGNIGPRKSLP